MGIFWFIHQRKSNSGKIYLKKKIDMRYIIYMYIYDIIQGVRFSPSFSKLDRFEIPPFWLVESEKDVGFCQNESFALAFSSLSNLEKEWKNLTPCRYRLWSKRHTSRLKDKKYWVHWDSNPWTFGLKHQLPVDLGKTKKIPISQI